MPIRRHLNKKFSKFLDFLFPNHKKTIQINAIHINANENINLLCLFIIKSKHKFCLLKKTVLVYCYLPGDEYVK